jgi:hypothetical protein
MSGQQRYSDDEFDRALRELAEGKAGEPRFREASAAERARQAKQQAKRARKQARRRRGRGHAGRGRVMAWTSVGVVLVLAAVGTFAWLQLRHPSTAATGAPVAPAVAVAAPPAGPPADPFASTPAKSWADGAAGIVLPAAKPVGKFTAVQVEAAYQTTRKLLIAADLNKPTLLGGTPTAYADLLMSQQRAQFLGGLNKQGVNKDGSQLSTRAWVTSFAPGSTELIGSVIKVRGTMSAKSVRVTNTTALIITVNYVFAYAIEPPATPSDWMRLVTHRHGSYEFVPWPDLGDPLQPWDDTTTSQAGGLCGATDGYLHPDYPSERGPGAHPSPTGPALNPYSFATYSPAGCTRSTGT